MPVPFPTDADADVNLDPPSYEESVRNAAGMLSATRPKTGNTEFQQVLIQATVESLTGHRIDIESLPFVDAATAAENLRFRAEGYRMRMVHMMVLSALVLRPIPPEVAEQVADYSREMGMDDDLLRTVEQFASSDKALAAVDFERNGYAADWSSERAEALHSDTELEHAWAADEDDPALATRWQAFAELEHGTLGREIHKFYRARGFAFPGTPGSAPPLLAQHDFVHILADYGTRVEAELEVFAFIARANDDPRGFSLLAMVVSLFETGYLAEGAGLFEAFPGQLSQEGMTVRIGDAMRRGALSHGLEGAPDVDFMQVDWFALADRQVTELQQLFGVVPKAEQAVAAGSVTPWMAGGISEAQLAMGQAAAAARNEPYEAFGASL